MAGQEKNVISRTTYVKDMRHGPEFYLSDSYGYDTVLLHQGNNSGDFACGTWTATFLEGHILTSDHGVCSPLDDEPDPDPDDTGMVQFVEIKGTVSISGGKLDGATLVIRNGDGGLLQNISTDSSGSYKTFVPARDVYQFAAEAVDAIGVSKTVNRNDRQQVVVNLDLTAVEKAPDNKPVITSITSSSGEIFLAGVELMNTYTIKIDWRGKSPATVHYSYDRTIQSLPATGDTVTVTLDMGSAFKGSPDPRRSRMRFVAVNGDGSMSAPFYANPVVLPIPTWTTALGGASFGLLPTAKYPAYALDGAYPDPGFEFQISQKTVPAAVWTVWQAIPWLGRGPMGFKETQFGFGLEAKTDGTGSVMGGFQTGFEIMNKELTGMGSAKGLLAYVPNRGLVWQGAEVGVGLGVTLTEEVDIGTVIPLLKSAENWKVVGGAIKRFNDAAKIEGTVAPSAALVFKVAYDEQKGLSFMEAAPEFGVAVSTVLTGEAGSKVKATIGGGGAGKVIGKIPGDNWIDKVEFELNFQLGLTIWNFTRQFTEKHTFSYPDTSTQGTLVPRPEGVELAGFVPMSVNFAQKAGYASFVANKKSAKQAVNANGVADTTLVMNGFPESDPVIAERNGKIAIAYVHFDSSDTALQGNEIAFTYYNGYYYTEAAVIADDTRSEFAPDIAFDSNGNVVAVWERIKSADFAGSELDDVPPELEIVYAVYTPGNSKWSAPTALTDDAQMDFSPKLCRAPNGAVTLFWQKNPDGELVGTDASPTTIMTAVWNAENKTFDTPAALPFTFKGASEFDFACDDTTATIAYIHDADLDLATLNDTELNVARMSSGTWAMPVALTSNSVIDGSPRLLTAGGQYPELLWLQDGELRRLTAWDTPASESVRPDSGSLQFTSFELARDSSDRIAVIWPAPIDDGADLFYSVYDPTRQTWGGDSRLTFNKPVEKDFEGLFAQDGVLHVVYNKLTPAPDEMSTDVVDLHRLEYELGTEIAMADDAVTIEPATAAAGDAVTIRAKVRNAGDFAVENVPVTFFHGRPGSGEMIGVVNVAPSPLPPGETGEALLQWTAPAQVSSEGFWVHVNRDYGISEQSYDNNFVTHKWARADLALSNCRVEEVGNGEVEMLATVINNGPEELNFVQLEFLVDGVSAGSAQVSRLLPGASADVSATVIDRFYFINRPSEVVCRVDPVDNIAETNEDNNESAFQVLIGTDTDGDGIDDAWERMFFGNLDKDGTDDSDMDGVSDRLEFLAGTHPADGQSSFRGGVMKPAAGNVEIQWLSTQGYSYRVQYKNAIGDAQWTDLTATMTPNGETTSVMDENAGAARFYRVLLITGE